MKILNKEKREPIILGIDPSSKHIAIAQYEPGILGLRLTKINLRLSKDNTYTPEVAKNALLSIDNYCENMLNRTEKDVLAYIESPVVGRGGARATMVQSFVNGVIQACLLKNNCYVYMVNVSVWKRDVIGNGRATKEEIANLVRVKWPKESSKANGDGDLIDAIAIANYGIDTRLRTRRIMAVSSIM